MSELLLRLRLAVLVLRGHFRPVEPEPGAGELLDGWDSHAAPEDYADPVPLLKVTCLSGEDAAQVFVGRARDYGPCVAIAVGNVRVASNVLLRPSTARALAAGLLNAADTLDGVTPLLYMPDRELEDE